MNDSEDLSWKQLKEALLERYGGWGEGSRYEQLTVLKQLGKEEEYIKSFEYLVARVPCIPNIGHVIKA